MDFAKFCEHLIKMKTQKTVNLLNISEYEYAKFRTKKCYVVDSKTNGTYSDENPIGLLTKSLESSLCESYYAYTLVTGNILYFIIFAGGDANSKNVLKGCSPFSKYRTEINDTFIDEAER